MPRVLSVIAAAALCLCSMDAQQGQRQERTIEIHAHRFAFDPSSVTVAAGETVRLRVISEDVPHSLLLKQLGVDITATKAKPGESLVKVDKPGDYAGRCGRFCGSGHAHMTFTLHVTPK